MLTSVSNKRISKTAPSVYLKEVEKAAGSNLEGWLASNLITMAAYKAAQNDDYDNFISIRAETISSAMNEKGGW
jgi:hypothetical protein